jgi:hypothetical protein
MLNIITPCSRPENLKTIEASINIPPAHYKWWIIFDNDKIPDCYIPPLAYVYAHTNPQSIVGHDQRNFALNIIENGYVYFNDDDTTIHPMLWQNIEYTMINQTNDFISFDQQWHNQTHRLSGSNIKVDHIDSHNFIVHSDLCKNIRFYIDRYNADGYFATQCFALSESPIYIPKYLSVYNALRSK